MRKKHTLILTPKQAELVEWALHAGLEQQIKFLQHDDWDADLSKKARYEYLWPTRRFRKAIDIFTKKLSASQREAPSKPRSSRRNAARK